MTEVSARIEWVGGLFSKLDAALAVRDETGGRVTWLGDDAGDAEAWHRAAHGLGVTITDEQARQWADKAATVAELSSAMSVKAIAGVARHD